MLKDIGYKKNDTWLTLVDPLENDDAVAESMALKCIKANDLDEI